MQHCRWLIYADAAALQQALVRAIEHCANESIKARGAFHIVLAGGHTPAAVYRGLAGRPCDWSAWCVYFGDERCLPQGAADRNDSMARACWLDRVAIPPAQIHPIPAELGAVAGAAAYRRTLAGVAAFDLVLLGLGEDGHTASLFPGQPSDDAAGSPVLAVHGAPKPPPERISLSAARLGAARQVWFLVSGEGKRQALERWRRGEDIPARRICPAAGVDVHTDIAPAAA
jgi:6-phosphogluconolactonase